MSELAKQQSRLTEHLRDPTRKGPEGVEARRLKIYRDLVYNNVQNFWRQGFPVLRSLLDDQQWHALVRAFLREHRSRSPYFHDISREAVTWMEGLAPERCPVPFLAALAHYEWVELALSIATETAPMAQIDPNGRLDLGAPAVSPLAWCLRYQWPVHRIGPSFRPEIAEGGPYHFIVHRDRRERVRFIDSNALTHALLESLRQTRLPARDVLLEMAALMQHPAPEALLTSGLDTLEKLRAQGVVLGTWLDA